MLVKPSVSLPPPEITTRSPAILSREEIARMRDERLPAPVFTPAAAEIIPITAPMVEMHAADMTPLPKNKGGRPPKPRG